MILQMNLKRLFSIACLVSLAACSAHKTVQPSSAYVVSAQSARGDSVMTVSSKGLYDVPFSLTYRKVANKSLFNIGQLSLTYGYQYGEQEHRDQSVFNSYAKKYGQFSDQNSTESMHVFSLPEGEYEFYGMFIEQDYEEAEWTMVSDFSFKFTVVPGKTSYIGNLVLTTKVIGNNDYIVESSLSRQNRAKGDKAILTELFPATDVNEVIISSDIARDNGVNIVRRHYGRERSLGRGWTD
jgi:hypothetical protein